MLAIRYRTSACRVLLVSVDIGLQRNLAEGHRLVRAACGEHAILKVDRALGHLHAARGNLGRLRHDLVQRVRRADEKPRIFKIAECRQVRRDSEDQPFVRSACRR